MTWHGAHGGFHRPTCLDNVTSIGDSLLAALGRLGGGISSAAAASRRQTDGSAAASQCRLRQRKWLGSYGGGVAASSAFENKAWRRAASKMKYQKSK